MFNFLTIDVMTSPAGVLSSARIPLSLVKSGKITRLSRLLGSCWLNM
jgi:hypothetical protein